MVVPDAVGATAVVVAVVAVVVAAVAGPAVGPAVPWQQQPAINKWSKS